MCPLSVLPAGNIRHVLGPAAFFLLAAETGAITWLARERPALSLHQLFRDTPTPRFVPKARSSPTMAFAISVT